MRRDIICWMKKIRINQRIVDSLCLSENEGRVLDVLLAQQMGKTPAKIAKLAGIPITTVVYILEKFKRHDLVIREIGVFGRKCPVWRYKKGLEFMRYKSSSDKFPIEIKFDQEV